MFAPATQNEIETYASVIDAQLEGIRAAVHGLTDEQARLTPTRSALSLAGILKHVTYVMSGRRRRAESAASTTEEYSAQFQSSMAGFFGSFAPTGEETLESLLTAFDAARDEVVAEISTVDPEADDVEPPAPWDDRPEPTPTKARYQLAHLVEELARHAGHADIIREQIDGADSGSLLLAVQGRPGNDFITPWQPDSAQA